MRKILHSLFISLLLLTSLSACSFGISNSRLEKDIMSLPCFYGTSKVKEMTVIEKSETSDLLEYKLSVLLKSYDFTTMADIKLAYTKTDGKWSLARNTVDLIKVSPNGDLQLNTKYEEAIHDISNRFFYHKSDSKAKVTLSLVSGKLSSDTLSGTGTLVISEKYSDDVLTMDVLYTLKATYNIVYGWTFELIDWVYHDSMKWTGTYDIHWTKEVPGYPEGGLNSFYKLDKDISGIQISGESSIIRRMGQPDNDIIENTLQINFDYAGVHLSGQPTFSSSSSQFYFEMAFNPDTLLMFEYCPFQVLREGNDPTNNYYGEAPLLEGILTRRP